MGAQTLLIVDDEPGNLAILGAILAIDYKVVFARNGSETLAAIVKHRPAMVLLDIGLPDIDGYTLCRQIKEFDTDHTIQVIFVTAYTDMKYETAGFEAGAVDYIVKPVSPPVVRARVAAHLSMVRATVLERSYRDAILMLAQAGHYNDSDTGAHIWRMAAYARALAQRCGWDAESSALLELAAPMHDTGKLGIPQAILRKPGPLDEQEWAIMKTHPQIGYNILSKSDAPVFVLAAEVALRHHEKWDGSGYPGGLSGNDIPPSARIVALADVFDALSMRRPYKEPWPIDNVMAHINASAGTHFDPAVVCALCTILPEILEIQQKWTVKEEHQREASVRQ
jgi:putative two-component system response regulator